MLAYTVAALSPNMDVANAALPTYVVVSRAGWMLGWLQWLATVGGSFTSLPLPKWMPEMQARAR